MVSPRRPRALLALALCGAGCPGTSADKAPGRDPTDSTDTTLSSDCYPDDDRDGYGSLDADPQTSESAACASGTSALNTDCDDDDASVNPGEAERCDLVDDDCDGEIDEGFEVGAVYVDADGDGFGDPSQASWGCVSAEGYAPDNTDCAPLDDQSFPGATEACDEQDNDCDGEIDEGLDSVPFYLDGDGDGFGDPATTDARCGPTAGWVDDATDCGPVDPHIHPEATEACDNGRDDDCDGLMDCEDDACLGVSTCGELDCADGADEDDDGYTDCEDDECWGDPGCPGVIVSWVIGVGALTGRDRLFHFRETSTCTSETRRHTSGSDTTSWDASDIVGSVRLYAPGEAVGSACAWSVDHADWRRRRQHSFELGVGTRESTNTSWNRRGLSLAGDCALDGSGFLPALPSLRVPNSDWYNATDVYRETDHNDGASGACDLWVSTMRASDWTAYGMGDGENFVVTWEGYAPL